VIAGSTLSCIGWQKIGRRYRPQHAGHGHLGRRLFSSTDPGSQVVLVAVLIAPVSSKIRPLAGGREELLPVATTLILLVAVGVAGRFLGMHPSWNPGSELAGAVFLWSADLGVALTNSESVNLALTVIWLTAVANAFRYADWSSRHAAGLAAIVSLTLFVLAATGGQVLVSTLAAGLTGCVIGFLLYSTRFESLLLGTSGSGIIGFTIAFLAIQVREPASYEESMINALTPILACSYTLFNLLLFLAGRLFLMGGSATAWTRPPSGHTPDNARLPSLWRSWSLSIATLIGILSFVVFRLKPIPAVLLVCIIGLAYLGVGVTLLRTDPTISAQWQQLACSIEGNTANKRDPQIHRVP